MPRLLLLTAFVVIAALVASDDVDSDLAAKDTVVPEKAMATSEEAEFLQASEHLFEHFNMKAEPKDAQNILKKLDHDKDTMSMEDHLALLKKYAPKIKDPVARKNTLDAIAKMEDQKEEMHDLKEQIKIEKADAKAIDAENRHVKYAEKGKKHQKAKHDELLESSTELFQYVYDEANTDPEYLEWKQLHQDWKALIQEHGIDTSKARTRSPEEHNDLVTRYIADTFVGVDSTATTMLSTGATLAGKCLHGTLQVIAPKFCWKGSHHNHQIPTKCPAGWRRWGAECFQNCRSGYYWVGGGTCWAYCRKGEEMLQSESHDGLEEGNNDTNEANGRALLGSGRRRRRAPYSDHGATCYRSLFDWYCKKHYWTSRFTNFDSRAQCSYSDQYKSGAMCYRACSKIPNGKTEMVNCGYDACSTDGSTCTSTIINMIMEIGFSIASIAAIVFSGGAAAPATAAGGALLRKSGAAAAKRVTLAAARSAMKSSAKAFGKKVTTKMGIKLLAKSAAKQIGMGWTENMVKNFCNEYAKAYHSSLTGNPSKFDPKSLDLSGTAAAIDSCGTGKAKTQPWTCAGAITSVLSVADPTGLLGVASAFMHDSCTAT